MAIYIVGLAIIIAIVFPDFIRAIFSAGYFLLLLAIFGAVFFYTYQHILDFP